VFEKEDGTFDGYCFSCGTYVSDPYHDKPKGYKPVAIRKSKEEIEKEIKDVADYKVVDLPERKLRAESLDYFGIKIGLSESDGVTPETHYYPYKRNGETVGYKVRLIANKKMWTIGDQKEVDLFGWDRAIETGAKKLFITEGEMDAAALYQICKDANRGTAYEKFSPAVVSLPHGAGNASRDLAKFVKTIRQYFKEVVFVFDMDEAGKKAIESSMLIIPDATVAFLPAKDVNDCLIQGKSKACYNAVQFNSSKPKNSRIINGRELHEAAKKVAEWGVSWPWKHITECTRGIRLGETIYIGAAQKMGKSEVVNTLAAHFIKEHGWKVFVAKPEEANAKTYKLVAGKMVGKFFHDPKIAFDMEAYERAGEMIGDSLLMVNLYQHLGWETLKADIREAAAEGCKAIMIDPITNLTNGMNAADANTKLQEIAQELSAMALNLNVVIFIFCHLRNPDAGLPHERGGEVLSSQFAGSRAMARSCNLMLGLEGNRDPNLTPEERNLRTLVLLEDREYGETGRFKLYWDNSTGMFNEL
jgi:twinkle protein